MFAAAAGPAFVRAGSIMRVNPAIVGSAYGVSKILTLDEFTRAALIIAHEKLSFMHLEREWSGGWAASNAPITIRKPPVFRRNVSEC